MRAIVGTPGASQFTGDLPIAGSVNKVYLPPHQKYLLIEQLATDPIAVVPFRGVTVGTPAAIPGALPRADLVAFSPSGGVAAFYNTTSDEAQVITGLPNTPQISHQIQQVKLPEPVSTLAISDDGSVFVAGSQGNHIYLLSQNSAPQLLWSAGDLAALAFYPAQHSLVACDRSSGSLVILDQVGTALTTRTLAGPLPSLGPGVNLQLDDSGKRVVISNPASNQVHVIDQSGSVQSLSLPASPVSIKQLANPTLFALTEVDGQSGLVLSLNSVPAQYFYVPRRVIVVQHVLKTGVQ